LQKGGKATFAEGMMISEVAPIAALRRSTIARPIGSVLWAALPDTVVVTSVVGAVECAL
jgi:hypothetical protein